MKERPILMTQENAQKCHDGTKTQTRRIVKLPAWSSEPTTGDIPAVLPHCPYGQAGERLWVREAFYVQPELWGQSHDLQPVHYAVAGHTAEVEDYVRKPAIHMPRWACRTVLEITGVRVERLQDCTTEDAIAEGAEDFEGECVLREKRLTKAQIQYAALWESINGKGSWELNPWVWVIEFRRVEEGNAND